MWHPHRSPWKKYFTENSEFLFNSMLLPPLWVKDYSFKFLWLDVPIAIEPPWIAFPLQAKSLINGSDNCGYVTLSLLELCLNNVYFYTSLSAFFPNQQGCTYMESDSMMHLFFTNSHTLSWLLNIYILHSFPLQFLPRQLPLLHCCSHVIFLQKDIIKFTERMQKKKVLFWQG